MFIQSMVILVGKPSPLCSSIVVNPKNDGVLTKAIMKRPQDTHTPIKHPSFIS